MTHSNQVDYYDTTMLVYMTDNILHVDTRMKDIGTTSTNEEIVMTYAILLIIWRW